MSLALIFNRLMMNSISFLTILKILAFAIDIM